MATEQKPSKRRVSDSPRAEDCPAPEPGAKAESEARRERELQEARLAAKAKRKHRKSSSRDSDRESGRESLSENTDGTVSKDKMGDKKSRSGKGRGLPKKGGAGGKGVWGAPVEVYDVEEPDIRDPNYDDDKQGETVFETVVPELNKDEFDKAVTSIIQEYFEHGDTKEVATLLGELNLGSKTNEVPFLSVLMSLEGKASHRELMSQLLADLTGRRLNAEHVATAFDKLLRNLPDLILDTPEAPQMLGQFVARAVADHVLTTDFLDSYKGMVDCEHARAALDRAALLLSINRGVRLDSVWGVGGGLRPVKQLVKEMNLLLKEYLLSTDTVEAERCLQVLEVPHFHHELVYEAVQMVLESVNDDASDLIAKLLKIFWESGFVTLDQMNRGFTRVFEAMPDISLDIPNSYSILKTFVHRCYKDGVITKALQDQCPSRDVKSALSGEEGGSVLLAAQ
ncbi:programmed cell death protein 4 [Callorhinchus milii]|uniref:Programmed cell death protein 4 n=1 Tax=Callorhinchus milii TaxID=7868 RepID=V9KST7_CALMI|nr:programmed cell death protein 4 [Callorhinchus milii]|eukprot:gi/632948470/ref/XP_007889616.1/ PREDICTED: programmed cell death protein 4-like [Callorhinchus milii]